MQTAREVVSTLIEQGAYPEDEWYGISETWDLNLFVDAEERNCATLYPIVKGNTDVRVGYPVLPPFSIPTLPSASTRRLLFTALRQLRDYDAAFCFLEEALTPAEGKTLRAFLAWVKADPDHRYFAETTFAARFAEWENTLQEGPSC
jgi:hypothetical protein